MLPIQMTRGRVGYWFPKGTPVVFTYDGNLRSGTIDQAVHPMTITVLTDHGYRQYSRNKIQDFSQR